MQSVIVRLIESNSPHQTKELFCLLFVSTKGARIRTKIMSLIKKRPRNTNQLSKEVDSDYKNIQYHLKILEDNNLVKQFGYRYSNTYHPSTFFKLNEQLFDEIIIKFGKNRSNSRLCKKRY